MALNVKLLSGVVAIVSASLGGLGFYEISKPKNVRESLIKEGKIVLNTNSNEPNNIVDQPEWTKITSKTSLQSELKEFLNIQEEVSNWNEKIPELKKKCEETLNISRYDESFKKALQDAEKYCTQTDQQ